MNKKYIVTETPEFIVARLKSRWLHLQPVLCEGTLWLGDWENNCYLDLETTDWVTAVARINEVRDEITANY